MLAIGETAHRGFNWLKTNGTQAEENWTENFIAELKTDLQLNWKQAQLNRKLMAELNWIAIRCRVKTGHWLFLTEIDGRWKQN